MVRRRGSIENARRAAFNGNTFDLLYEEYGQTMAFGDVCRILNCSPKSGYHRVRRGTFPIKVWKNPAGHFNAMTGDVAVYIDQQRREGR